MPPLCSSWTVTTADELYNCITEANINGAGLDTITLGADIDLRTLTIRPLPQITSTIVVEGAGYAIDGGDSIRIFNVGASGDLTVNQATLQTGYASDNGGGISNSGTLTVTNSTISGNTAYNNGGGIYNNSTGTLMLTNNTFSGNNAYNAGGLFNDGGTVYIAGNIFEETYGGNCANTGTLNDNGYNLSDDASCGFTGTGSANNATLNLGALSGGVHTPQAGSDAIGAIPNGISINNNGVTLACNGTTTDQLGSTRPSTQARIVRVAQSKELQLCPSWTVTIADELEDCITKANTNGAGLDTITLGADINLTSLLPQITSTIVVEGAGYAIDGGSSVQIFNVGASGNLTVNQATLQNGSADNGGGILTAGTVTVSNSTFSGNAATSGGGIFSSWHGDGDQQHLLRQLCWHTAAASATMAR